MRRAASLVLSVFPLVWLAVIVCMAGAPRDGIDVALLITLSITATMSFYVLLVSTGLTRGYGLMESLFRLCSRRVLGPVGRI